MNEILLLPAAIFFLIIGSYNLYQTYKKKETYIPVIACFLMFFVTLVMYFSPLLGSLCLFLSMIILASKWPDIKKYQQKRILDNFSKYDYSKKLKLKDILSGTKLWGKLARDHGAKKAALAYSLWIGGSLFIFLNLLCIFNSPIKPDLQFIVIFTSTYLVFSYYQMHGYFKKFIAANKNISKK